MSHLNRIRITSLAALVLVTMLYADSSAFAQSPPQPPPPLAPPASQMTPVQPSGPTLSLTMDEAVAMALETNLGLKSFRLNLDMASQSVAGARSVFLPQLQSQFSRNTTRQAPQTLDNGTIAVASSNSLNVGATFSESLPWYGSRYNVQWSGNRNASIGSNSTFNPRLGSSFNVNFTQPLLRGLVTDANRYGLDAAGRQREVTDLQLQGQIVTTEIAVRNAYLGLIASIEGRKVAQDNIDLNQKQLDNSKSKVAVGAAAQIDIIQAEASVATSQEQVIFAEASVASAEDQLRALIVDPARPDYWQVHIEAKDSIVQPESVREIDVDAAIRNALASRLDLLASRHNLEITALGVQLDNDLTRTQVDFFVNYAASGTGGTQLVNTVPSIKGFSSVLGDALGGAFPSWTLGVNVGVPIGQSGAQTTLARAHLQQQQQQIDLRNLELTVVQSVRQAARDVQTNFKAVQAALKAKEANQLQLEAEQRKQAVGLSTTFDVLLKQSFLASARVAWLTAIIQYNQSLIKFDRVQKIQ